MFKVKNKTSLTPEKIELKSLSFSRIFILNNVLVIIYDDFILINNNKIYFKISYAIKIDSNQLYITDGHKYFLLDFKKYSIKEINQNNKTIKENEICINDDKISYRSYEIENEIKYGDLDYNGNENTYYYTCNVSDYLLICNNKSCTIYLYNNKLEEIANDMIYVHCRKDNTPLYLRGMDSNENVILTLDEEGTINKYIINEDISTQEFQFIFYEGNEIYSIFKEIIRKKDIEKGIIDTNKCKSTFVEKDSKNILEDLTNDELNLQNKNNESHDISCLTDSFEDIKNDSLETKHISEDVENNTANVNNHLENLINNMSVQKSNTIEMKDNLQVYNNAEDISKNMIFQNNKLSEKTVEMKNKKVEIEDNFEETVSMSTLINSSTNQLKNSVKKTINNIYKDSKDTVEKSVKQIDDNLKKEKNTFQSISNDFSPIINTSNSYIQKNTTLNHQQIINDTKNCLEVNNFNSNSFDNQVEKSKKPTTSEILSFSTEKIILDIKNIKVNKFHFSNYKLNEFNVDSDMTELYNNILKLENVNCFKKDLEDKLLFMINNLKIRQGIDSDYVKDSIKYFDKKLNEKNILKMPFVYNTGIISDNCINNIVEEKAKIKNGICKVDLIKVYETDNLILIKNKNTTSIKEMKQEPVNLKIDKSETDKFRVNLDYEKEDLGYKLEEQKNQEPICIKKNEEIINDKRIDLNLGTQTGISNNIPSFSFSSNPTQTFPSSSSDIFNKFINNNSGSSIPVLPKENKKDDGKVPNAFSRFANSNNLYK